MGHFQLRPSRYRSVLTGISVAALSLAIADRATAQVTATGSNFPSPVVSGTTDNYYIGSGGTGTLSILGGSSFTAGSLSAADGFDANANGTITIDGSGTLVTLNPQAQTNILQSGNWGVGLITISGGAVVDGTNTAACSQGWCNSFVGNGAGSTGTLNITGTGSTLSLPTSTSFGVGQASVLLYNGSQFGTPGGATNAFLNVTAGGALNTGDATVGSGFFGASPGYDGNGNEFATGTAVVDGGTWNVTSPDNYGLGLGQGDNSSGALTVKNGGVINLYASTASGQVGFDLGYTYQKPGSATGTATVDGGSIVFKSGVNDYVADGDSQGSGSITIKNGGSITGALSATVGQDGGTGSLTVDGQNSKISLSGSGTSNGAFFGVGWVNSTSNAATLGPTTTGTVTVENGGQIIVDTDGNEYGGFAIGKNGGSGTVTVTGAGSAITVSGDNNNTNNGGGSTIGQSGAGTLEILAGGQVNIDNTSTASTGGASGMAIGGDPYQVGQGAQPGTGAVTVSGAGSQLNIQSAHGFIEAGYTGTGTLDVANGGVVTAEGLAIARIAGSVGTVAVDGAGSSITLSGADSSTGSGARVQVGAGGAGSLSLTNGASLQVNPSNANGGIIIGGIGGLYGGVGTMTVSGGSTAFVSGTNEVLDVGRNGTGTLTITGGSTVDVAHGVGSTGQTFVGATASYFSPPVGGPLTGTVTVAGGSTLNAGSLLGIGSDGAGNNNTGSGVVNLTGLSTVNAITVVIGQNGALGGNGTVNGNVSNNGGVLNVGASPDALYINGDYTQNGGKIDFEIDPNSHGGFLWSTLVFGSGDSVSINDADIVLNFLNGASPTQFIADGLDTFDTFFRVQNPGGGDLPLSSELDLATVFSNVTVTVNVPEPSTWALMVLGFAGLGFAGYRRARFSRAA
ncbi:MAG: PEP-CTERM sorting domain-containing protein [Roseiarcus sp.]